MGINNVPLNKFSAPAKLILSGEHAVVYGYPAIATAVNLRLTADSSGKIDSNIPIGAGMGSSAAFAVVASALKLGDINLEKINDMAYILEKGLHGNPSGVDNTVVTYGGFLWYRKENESFKTFKQIEAKVNLPKIYLLDTGKPSESTKEMVGMVGKRYSSRTTSTENIFKSIEKTTKGFLNLLLGGKEEFGELISENERLLEELGVVSDKAKELIRVIEKTGGYAKISGAGGKKDGSGMAIVYYKDIEKISLLKKRYGIIIRPVKIGEEGLRIEK